MRKNSKFKFKKKKYIERTNIKQILEISFYK